MAYDRRGNRIGMADPIRNERYGGDPRDNAATRNRRRATYYFDEADRQTGVTESPGHLELFSSTGYDRNGNVRWTTDPRHHATGQWFPYATQYDYDERDLLTAEQKPDERRTTYVRRPDGKVETIISPRAVTENAPDGTFQTKLTYDPLGSVIERTLPKTPGGYDPQGPDKWTYQRDAVGNPTRIVDGRGKAYENTFLDTGDVKTTTRPGMWQADAQAGKAGERDPSQVGNSAEPADVPSGEGEGDFGAVDPERMPDLLAKAGPTELRYDDELRLTEIVERDPSAANATTTLTRDAVGRLTKLRRPLDQGAARFIEQSMGYDRNGNLAESTDGAGNVTRMTYDGFDRVVEEATPSSSDGAPEVTRSTYDANGNVTAIQSPRGPDVTEHRCYDPVDRLTHTVNPEGEMTVFGYDPAGNRTTVLKPKGVGARETSPADCSDDLAPAVYDPQTSLTRAAYKTVTAYNGNNEATEVLEGTDAEKVTRLGYDADGNQISVDAPGAQSDASAGSMARRKTTSSFDARGLPWKSTTGEGEHRRTRITEFDGNGNLRREVNPKGTLLDVAKEPDAAPQQTSIDSRPDRENDALRRATIDATVFEYSDDNLLTVRHMPHDGTSADERFRQSFRLDARGRVSEVDAPHPWTKQPRVCTSKDVDPSCIARTQFTHLDTGWIKQQTGGQGAEASAGGTGGEATGVGGELQSYDYDERGLQTTWRSASSDGRASRTMRRSYWPSGALRQRRAESDGIPGAKPRVYDYRYSGSGQLTSMTDRGDNAGDAEASDDRAYRMAYDKADRQVATDEDPYNGQPGRDTLVEYDLNGNTTKRQVDGALSAPVANGLLASGTTHAGGPTTTFDYDAYDRETSARVGRAGDDDQLFQTSYWPSGDRRTRQELGETPLSPRVHEQSYWANDGREWGLIRKTGDGSGPTVKTQDYRYDANGTRVKDEIGDHEFNARDQLTKWTRPGGASSVTYTVTGGGDVLKAVDTKGTNTTTENTLVAGRLKASKTTAAGTPDVSIGFAYDPTGANVSQISEKVGSGAEQVKSKFAFDAFDRISSQEKVTGDSDGPANKTAYTYDGFDRRDSMVEETSGQPIKKANLSYVGTSDTLSLRERSNADGTGTKTTVGFDYDSGLDSLGMARRADGAATGTYASFAKDANGSIEGLAGTAGAYSSRNAYDPYGNKQDVAAVPGQTPAMVDEANDQPFRFQGFYLDSGVKTYDMRARQYLPQAGRFLTQDRFESSQGDFNLVSDPLIQSRYAFAGGNPISNVEFDGHCPIKNRCPGTRKGTPGGRSKAPSSGGDRDGSGGPNGDGRLNSGRRPVPAPPTPARGPARPQAEAKPGPKPSGGERALKWIGRRTGVGAEVKPSSSSVGRTPRISLFNDNPRKAAEKGLELASLSPWGRGARVAKEVVDEGAEQIGKRGGRFGDLPKVPGNHRHHMPANSTNDVPRNDGPAISMSARDHRRTESSGGGRSAERYRQKQRDLQGAGRRDDAIQMDIDDIQGKFGNEHDNAIEELIDGLD